MRKSICFITIDNKYFESYEEARRHATLVYQAALEDFTQGWVKGDPEEPLIVKIDKFLPELNQLWELKKDMTELDKA